MKVSREQMAENRKRILAEAARLFRAKGFDGVSVAEVMKAAGLTHGGFYGHFASKDELIAQTVAQCLECSHDKPQALAALVADYLTPQHRDDAGTGCATAALAADVSRQSPDVRLAMADGLRAQLAQIEGPCADGQTSRRQAIGTWSAMVGALILARAVDDPALSDEILLETREWINDASSKV